VENLRGLRSKPRDTDRESEGLKETEVFSATEDVEGLKVEGDLMSEMD